MESPQISPSPAMIPAPMGSGGGRRIRPEGSDLEIRDLKVQPDENWDEEKPTVFAEDDFSSFPFFVLIN